MSRADDIRARAEAEARVAELEDELIAAKDDDSLTAELKAELRYARWVQRGGPAEEADLLAAQASLLEQTSDGEYTADDLAVAHTNRAVAGMYQRWLSEQEA